jgi:hypothetical protein
MTLPVQTAVCPYRALGKSPKIPLSHVSSAAHDRPALYDNSPTLPVTRRPGYPSSRLGGLP